MGLGLCPSKDHNFPTHPSMYRSFSFLSLKQTFVYDHIGCLLSPAWMDLTQQGTGEAQYLPHCSSTKYCNLTT